MNSAATEGYLIAGSALLLCWAWVIVRHRRVRSAERLVATTSQFAHISQPAVRALRRALPALLTAVTCFFAMGVIGRLRPDDWRSQPGWLVLGWSVIALMAASLLAAIAVSLFARPRWLIARRHRAEPGYLKELPRLLRGD